MQLGKTQAALDLVALVDKNEQRFAGAHALESNVVSAFARGLCLHMNRFD